MYKILKEARADIMLSGGRSQFVALKAKMPWLDINQERHYGYAGYDGMVALVREMDKTLSNPVWAQVRTPAPWDEVSWEERADAANAADAASPEPEAAEAKPVRRICDCMEVDEATIEAAIRTHKLLRVEDVRAHTKASSGCGSCTPRIAKILQRINGVKVPAFEQENEAAAKAPSPCPSPARGEGTPLQPARPAPSPPPHPLADAVLSSRELALASSPGEGWGEGECIARDVNSPDTPTIEAA
jgi:bacterioferritin-associated ferredoxin